MNNLTLNTKDEPIIKLFNKNLKNHQNLDKLKEITLNFINATSAKYQNLDLSDNQNLYELKNYINNWTKKNIKDLFDKWTLRAGLFNILDELGIDIAEQTVRKIVFLLLTDSISEIVSEATPLIFKNKNQILVKRNGLVLEYELFPLIIESIINLNPEKKHQIVLDMYPDDILLFEGISKYLAVTDYLIFNLFEKLIYAGIVQKDQIIDEKTIQKGKKEEINDIIQTIFEGISEVVLKEKSKPSAIVKDSKQKIKNFVRKILKNEDEAEYLKQVAEFDEQVTENRSSLAVDYQVQENVFKESKKREGVSPVGKIEAVVWLIGINNLKLPLLFRYYSGDDILGYVDYIINLAKKDNFYSQRFKEGMELFLKAAFEYPYLSENFENKNLLDQILTDFDKETEINYLYFKRDYSGFLEKIKDVEKDDRLKLKQLLSRYFNDEIEKEELLSWLSFLQSPDAQFIYNLLNNSLDNYPFTDEYRYIIDLMKVRASHNDIFQNIGEERTYQLIFNLLGLYPYDNTLKNLLNLKF